MRLLERGRGGRARWPCVQPGGTGFDHLIKMLLLCFFTVTFLSPFVFNMVFFFEGNFETLFLIPLSLILVSTNISSFN